MMISIALNLSSIESGGDALYFSRTDARTSSLICSGDGGGMGGAGCLEYFDTDTPFMANDNRDDFPFDNDLNSLACM